MLSSELALPLTSIHPPAPPPPPPSPSQELEAGLLPKLEDTLLEVETNVIMRYIIPKDKGITRDNVRAVLLDCFKFSHHVRRRFALAFNKRNSARSMYAR